MLGVQSLNPQMGKDTYVADVLISHLKSDRILRIFKRQIQLTGTLLKHFIVPINVEATHWYLGVLQQSEAGVYELITQNNCQGLINKQAGDS